MLRLLGLVKLLAAAPIPGFEHEDVSDLIGIGSQVAPGDMSKVDSDLSSDAREQRMTACVRTARSFVQDRPDEVEATVANLMAQSQPGQPELTEEQAADQFFSMSVLACYEAIDNETISEVLTSQKRLAEQTVESLFRNVMTPRRPTRQQGELYGKILQEEQARILAEMTLDDMPGALGNIGRKMSATTKAAYVLLVLTGLGLFGAWSLWRMTPNERPKERSSKSWRSCSGPWMAGNGW